ncbi:hypothetical protein [Merismopedia glauca]|nr:hypothetical protein [Merismopedia glauca]
MLNYRGVLSLDIIPRLWAIARQSETPRVVDIMAIVQQRSGRYNPDFIA